LSNLAFMEVLYAGLSRLVTPSALAFADFDYTVVITGGLRNRPSHVAVPSLFQYQFPDADAVIIRAFKGRSPCPCQICLFLCNRSRLHRTLAHAVPQHRAGKGFQNAAAAIASAYHDLRGNLDALFADQLQYFQ